VLYIYTVSHATPSRKPPINRDSSISTPPFARHISGPRQLRGHWLSTHLERHTLAVALRLIPGVATWQGHEDSKTTKNIGWALPRSSRLASLTVFIIFIQPNSEKNGCYMIESTQHGIHQRMKLWSMANLHGTHKNMGCKSCMYENLCSSIYLAKK